MDGSHHSRGRRGFQLAETFIGLALIAGALVRLPAFGGAVFMAFFWVGNAEFGHGVVNGDLMGLGAGRYYGLDAVLERLALVENYPRLERLLGYRGDSTMTATIDTVALTLSSTLYWLVSSSSAW